MADILKPDLCIIGAGALGTSLAIAARRQGAEVLLVDRGPEPGDGTNYRLHRLALTATAGRAEAIRTAGRLGLDVAEAKVNFRAIAEYAARTAAAAAPRMADARLAALGITVLAGTAVFADRNALSIGDTSIRAGHFVLALGDRPFIPDLPGLDAVPYFTPETILGHLRKITHLVVIGGGPDALELAQTYRRLGSGVTLVPQGEVLPGFDREAVAVLVRELVAEGIAVLEGAAATAVKPRSQGTGVIITRADGTTDSLDVSHILLALGHVPESTTELVANARLKPDLSGNRRISVVGSLAGHDDPSLVAAHAHAVLETVLGRRTKFEPQRVVRHAATVPAIAQVGQLDGASVLRSSPAETDPALAVGDTAGTAKLVVSAKGIVLGGVMVGTGALETITMLALGIDRSITLNDLEALILPPSSPAAVLSAIVRQQTAGMPAARQRGAGAALRRLLP